MRNIDQPGVRTTTEHHTLHGAGVMIRQAEIGRDGDDRGHVKIVMTPTSLLYFDNNATTPVAPEVADTLAAAVRDTYGNASSAHAAGQLARRSLEQARAAITKSLNAAPNAFVFTSGGTESDNLAILGVARNFPAGRKHVITTRLEHPAVLESCHQLEREGFEVSYVDANSTGIVEAETIRTNIRPETVLASVMHANNELGVIQPIEEIAAIVQERRTAGQPIFFHSDGVQAFGKIQTDVDRLGVDAYSISGHKIFGPKGIGGLYARGTVPVHGIQFGGQHERGRRAGTENVPAALALARAVELCATEDSVGIAKLRDHFEREVLARVPDVEINGSPARRLPNTSNLLFHGVSGEGLLIALDMRGIAVSTGAACSSGAVEPSHVLLAIGRSREEARSSIRFSFGRYNTDEDVETLINAVVACVGKLRSAARRENQVAIG